MSRAVQYGVPMAIISLLTVALSVVAMLLNSVLLAVPSLLVISTSYFAIRNYLRAAHGATSRRGRRTPGSTRRSPRPSRARTVEALGLSGRRVAQGDDDIAVSAQAERYTMSLRNLLFAVIDVAFNTPRVITLVVGAWGYAYGYLSLGQITGRALRRGAQRAARPAGRRAGPAAGRCDDRAAARHRGGAAGPDAPRRTPGRATAGRSGPALRLPPGPRRPPRHRPRPEHRRATGDRRSLRLRQVHARPAAVRDQPAAHRLGRRRRGGTGRPAAGGPPHRGGAGHPGAPRLHRHGAGQRRARTRGLLRRGGVGCPRRSAPGLGGAAAARPGHQDRLRPTVADACAGAADRPGAADHRRPSHAGARRGHLPDRPAHRARSRGR